MSSSSSKPAEVFRGNDNYWTDPKNKFSFEGSALETFFKKPLETIGNYIKGGKLPTITDTSGVNREEPDGRKKAESTSKEQASATKEQTPVIKDISGAVTDLTSSNSDLSQMMGLLPSELQAAFESTTPDYDSMAKYLNKEFATSITAKDLQDQDAYDSKTHDDLIAPILAAMGISAAKLAEIKESSEDTEESTKKTAEHTSGLKGFDVEHLMNDVFGKPSTGTIGDDYAATTPAGTGTGTAPGTGAGSGSGGYGGAVRIGLDERGRETAVIGSVRQRSWEEEGKTWGATQFSEAARNAMSVGNSIMPVSADTTQAEASITAAKTIAAQPTKSNHWIYVDDSSVKNAIAFNKQPTWSQHTIYETTIKKALAGAGNYGDPIPSNLPKLKGTPNMNINNIPAFAEGGYTGAYSGPATVHPWEVVLNAAQQSNVAGVIGGGAAKTIQIFIDARGAVITDGSMDTLVAKIKSALQDESYR